MPFPNECYLLGPRNGYVVCRMLHFVVEGIGIRGSCLVVGGTGLLVFRCLLFLGGCLVTNGFPLQIIYSFHIILVFLNTILVQMIISSKLNAIPYIIRYVFRNSV